MEDFDIINKFDNDKLIDVVKNYKRYGYDDELRDYAINLLGERYGDTEMPDRPSPHGRRFVQPA